MFGPFVHRIDPVIGEFAGLYLWWYGLSYSLGFLGLHLWMRRVRGKLGFTRREVYGISFYLIAGVLIGGRLVEVVFYEWAYYGSRPFQIPAVWLGGMSSHGLLLGAAVSTWLFCRLHGKDFLAVADELVIPGAWVMGTGRIGNFIDGQILGATTDVWWGVQFPDAPGFRHPVVLYDGVKNLLLIPLLLFIRRSNPAKGFIFAHFLFWYAFLRLFVDLFREYRVSLLEMGTGQVINLAMALTGFILIFWFSKRGGREDPAADPIRMSRGAKAPLKTVQLWIRRLVLAALLLFCLVMPSDWTQDIHARYGSRHEGLEYSPLYPPIPMNPTKPE